MGTKKVVAGLAIAAAVVVVVVVPCVLLIPDDDGASSVADLPPFTFDDLYNTDGSNKFSYDYLYPVWDTSTTASTDHLSMNGNREIVRKDLTSPDVAGDVIFGNNLYNEKKANGYSVSATTEYIFYRYNYQKVWRHSYMADFVVGKSNGNSVDEVSISGWPSAGSQMIHYMKWSPTGNKLAVVMGWNLYFVDMDAPTPTLTQITNDGAENKVYNGIPDWVYEEESISGNNVLYWSPDANRIAFLKTNDENTTIIEYSMYDDDQYPRTVKIAYPKAGSNIGVGTLHVYDIATLTTMDLKSPYADSGIEHYFHRFVWMGSDRCLPTWSNRVQNESIATWCEYNSGSGGSSGSFNCTKTGAANMEKVTNGWVGSFNPFDVKTKGEDGEYFTIYARPNDGDASDGYWQLAYVTPTTMNDDYQWLTNSQHDIVELIHYDVTNDYIYFLSVHDEARDRQVMRVKSDQRDVTDPECMTCNLNTLYPDRCRWVAATFNSENDAVVINCRGPKEPLTVHINIDASGNWKNSGSEIQMIYSNTELIKNVKTVKWPVREYGKFKSPKSPYYEYNYEVWRPADFDPKKKYPLLIEVYAGPEFQKITSTWSKSFSSTYMPSSRDIIVASVDGRGSAYQGYKFMQEVYMKLGQFEKVDQTDFANYLVNQHDYIDADNVAIWGWSYGGYTTSHTLGYDGGNTFKCGVAVAPLADWRFYDAMYAERYMRMPADNKDGYDKASIITGNGNLDGFKGTWYTLIHGTSDDNVHFQNAAEMEKALVEADIDFDDFFYADQAHSINIGNANRHVYRQIDHRLSTCLGQISSYYPENYISPKFIRHH